jgi:mannonate dehydratase
MLFGITDLQMSETIDQDWAAITSGFVASSDLDFAVVLGFDGVYDLRGELDLNRSQLIVPPSWVFRVCERYSNLLPAPSIHPYRSDAMDVLDECIDRGATLIKWLPIVQAFDPARPRCRPFLRRMADAGLPLLIHLGTGEMTFRTVDPTVGALQGVVPALEEGVKVVCAHTAAPIHLSRERSELPLLHDLMERYPNLWVDNSGLANPARYRHLPRFADDDRIASRTLHGSDYPVISSGVYYARRLGRRALLKITTERNPLQKDVELKRSIGFSDSSMTRASDVLANLHRWRSSSS